MFSFMTSFLGAKGKEIGQEVVQALVEMDPEAATQAQLEQMEKDLDQAGLVLQKIRADHDREVREADAATKRYDQMMAAAEHLQKQLDDPATPADRKPGLETSLAKLVAQLEEFAPEVDRERADVVEVQALLDEAHEAYKIKAQALAQAKQKLDRAKRDMQRASMEQERSEEKARRAAEVAGLRQGTGNKLNVALDAMQRRAEEARAKAAASKMKSEALSQVASAPEGDPNIAAALKAVEGTARPGNLSDRLSALKKR